PLHPRRYFDAHQVQRGPELIAHVNDPRRAPPLSAFAALIENRRAAGRKIVKRAERLRERERVLRQYRELQRPNHLVDDFIEPRRLQNKRPELMTIGAVEFVGWRVAQCLDYRRLVDAVTLMQVLKDLVRAHDGVLNVWTALAFEAERLLEVERNHLASRELDHEIPNRGNRDHPRDALAFVHVEFGVARADLTARGRDQRVEQIVCFHAEPFSS